MLGRMDDEARANLGDAVRRKRLSLGLSIDQAAERSGMSPVTWSRVEQGKPVRALSYAAIERLFRWKSGTAETGDPQEIEGLIGEYHFTEEQAIQIARQLPHETIRTIYEESRLLPDDSIEPESPGETDPQLEQLLELWTRMGSRQRQAVIMLAEELLAAGAEPNDAHEGRSA